MNTAHARSPARHRTPNGALLAALERPRYEVLPLTGITEDVLAHVPPAVKVTVTASPSRGLEPTLQVVESLVACG
jgi:methylenetetrahydrofolate reductase (NADPH)